MAKALLAGQSVGHLPRPALISVIVGIALVPVVGISSSWLLSVFLIACLGFTATMTGVSMQAAVRRLPNTASLLHDRRQEFLRSFG